MFWVAQVLFRKKTLPHQTIGRRDDPLPPLHTDSAATPDRATVSCIRRHGQHGLEVTRDRPSTIPIRVGVAQGDEQRERV